ncbi:MAG TPA: T9SS type A sorting domain-containing protein [Flavobacteriales bacterium]|nr:T9SS type A sorting domain-containing protein [Flavobacteriales bacterium]
MQARYAIPFALFLSTSAFAQITHPFPDSDTKWVNTFYTVYPFPPPALYVLTSVDSICVYGSDTLINSIPYKQVHHCGGAYKGAWRDDAGVVYYVPGDSATEFVLYDFTLDAGGTTTVYHESNGQGMLTDVEVGDVQTSTEYGGTRKVQHLSSGATWIEGIGPTWGLFTEPWVNVSNYELRLECMSQADSIHFPAQDVGAGTCSFTMGVEEEPAGSSIILQPNPTQGQVRVIAPRLQAPLRVDVLDVQGRMMLSVPRLKADGNMDLSSLPSGVYSVQIRSASSSVVQRLVVEH